MKCWQVVLKVKLCYISLKIITTIDRIISSKTREPGVSFLHLFVNSYLSSSSVNFFRVFWLPLAQYFFNSDLPIRTFKAYKYENVPRIGSSYLYQQES